MFLIVGNINNLMPLLDSYDTFIFDWDGTLSTSTFAVRLSRFLRRRYSASYVTAHVKEYARKGINVKDLTTVINAEKANKRYEALYNLYAMIFMPKIKPGAIEVLKFLKSKGKRVIIFSDSKSYRLLYEVRRLGVSKYIDFVLGASTIDSYKPDPSGLLFIIKKYKANKKSCVYIGDMVTDVLTAKLAGISSCGVSDGFDSTSLLSSSKPDYIYDSLNNMLEDMKETD
jgi:HAD superfamily hydrolase (TIGR01549 family)